MTSTRNRILREARTQLLDRGYAAFTVAGVRDALGLSSGSMFHAFPSKAALAAAVHVDGMVDYQRTAVAALDTGDGPESSLRALVAAHLAWVEDNAAMAGWLFSTLPDDVAAIALPDLAKPNEAFFGRLVQLYLDWEPAAEAGRDGFPLIHAVAVGPTQEYCRQWVRGRVSRPPRELTAALQDAAVAAVLAARPHL